MVPSSIHDLLTSPLLPRPCPRPYVARGFIREAMHTANEQTPAPLSDSAPPLPFAFLTLQAAGSLTAHALLLGHLRLLCIRPDLASLVSLSDDGGGGATAGIFVSKTPS